MPPSHGFDIFGLGFKVILLTFLASVHILLNFLVSVHILWNVMVKKSPWNRWYPRDAKLALGTELCVMMFIWRGLPLGVCFAFSGYQ